MTLFGKRPPVMLSLGLGLCIVWSTLAAPALSAGLKDMVPGMKKAEPQKIAIRDKWALVIAVGEFQDSSISAIPVAAANATHLAQTLKDPFAGRFAPDHVKTLIGKDATTSGITAATEEWLYRKALPGDLIVVYICSKMSTPSGNPVVFTHDTLGSEAEISGLKLKDFLSGIKRRTQSNNIVCILDCSATQANSDSALSALAQSTGVAIMSAAKAGQNSFNHSDSGTSYFTNDLCTSMRLMAGAAPIQLLQDYVRKNVSEKVQQRMSAQQTPELAIPEGSLIAEIPLGIPVKSSLPEQTYSMGHPIDQLALTHPDLIPPRQSGKAPKIPAPSGEAAGTPATAGSTQAKPASTPASTPAKAGAAKPASKPSSKTASTADEDDEDDFDTNVDFGDYMTYMKGHIQKHWTPPKNMESRRLVAVFSIKRDGTIINPQIVEGSGIPELDKSAMSALAAASPLPPLPAGSPRSVEIRYVFDWKMRQGNQ